MDRIDDQFSLKWNNFRSNLTEGFHNFLQEEMMVDVTLAVEGKFLQAHKLVLSVCSPYFKSLFNVNPCKHPIVILKDVTHHELSNVLQFMYKGEVGVKHEELPSFLKLADTLKLKGLAGIKIDNEIDSTSSQDHSIASRVKKKVDNHYPHLDIENTDSDAGPNRLKELRSARQIKRRFSNPVRLNSKKSSQLKKMKGGKSDLGFQNENSCDDYAVDRENDDLVKLIVDKEKNKEGEAEDVHSHVDDIFDSETPEGKTSSEECDLSAGFFESSAEAEEAPQEFINCCGLHPKRSGRKSYIWKYFIKYQSSATCKLCGRSFRGFRPHTSIEFHLKNRHPREYQEFILIREKQRQILEKNHYLMFSKFLEEFHGKM